MSTKNKKGKYPDISKQSGRDEVVFRRINILIILVACAIICIGFVLMAGNGSTESSFAADIFSHRRIVTAPLICLLGYLMVVVGIVYHGSNK